MPGGDRRLEFTDRASHHLMSIRLFGTKEWGSDQSAKYLSRILTVGELLIRNPEIGVVHDEFGDGVRTFPVERHIIVYRPADSVVKILAVVSIGADVWRALESDF